MLLLLIDKNRKQYYIRGKKWVSDIHGKLPIPNWGGAGRREYNVKGMGSLYDK